VVPWEIAFLPDGRALITERPGRVRLLTRNHRLLLAATVAVSAVNGGGALGLALDPAFIRNRFVYLYRTTTAGNEILRYRLVGSRLVGQRVIAHGMPPGSDHHGGRIHFGPDRWLYITTGDTRNPPLSQDRGSLAGKLLRLSPVAYRGARPGRPSIFALGLRNPQGFDWQPHTRLLVATDHGPSGFDGPHGDDEINIVRRGANYGWPIAEGVQTHVGLTSPTVLYRQAIAPSGATFMHKPGSAWSGDYLIACLVGQQIRRVRLRAERAVINQPLFVGRFGRLRTVVEGPDGALYALTSNRDGNTPGSPRPGDDRVLRIVPPAD
jgi:glucose/arabinose dehydrogenase